MKNWLLHDQRSSWSQDLCWSHPLTRGQVLQFFLNLQQQPLAVSQLTRSMWQSVTNLCVLPGPACSPRWELMNCQGCGKKTRTWRQRERNKNANICVQRTNLLSLRLCRHFVWLWQLSHLFPCNRWLVRPKPKAVFVGDFVWTHPFSLLFAFFFSLPSFYASSSFMVDLDYDVN